MKKQDLIDMIYREFIKDNLALVTLMKRHTIQKIYLDTNVLINYCTGQAKEREALGILYEMLKLSP